MAPKAIMPSSYQLLELCKGQALRSISSPVGSTIDYHCPQATHCEYVSGQATSPAQEPIVLFQRIL